MHFICVIRGVARVKYEYFVSPLSSDPSDTISSFLQALPWYSPSTPAPTVHLSTDGATTRVDIDDPCHPGLKVFVFKPSPGKIWLFAPQGLMGELLETGVIKAGGRSFQSFSAFLNHDQVQMNGNTPFWFNGHCGSLRQFSSVVGNLKELHRAILQSVAPQLEGSGADESRMDEDESDRDDSGDERHPTIRRRMKQEQQHEQ